jgi:hypothetical protein
MQPAALAQKDYLRPRNSVAGHRSCQAFSVSKRR